MIEIIHGDCIVVLKEFEANSFSACVTDPPAGIAFMGRDWDSDRGGRRQWVAWMTAVAYEVFRVCKPGAHALVWALPRTSHWTGWAWEDAGWMPRDCVYHLFGSGFPKSLDVSKAIDRAGAYEGMAIRSEIARLIAKSGLSDQQIADTTGVSSALVRFWRLQKRNIMTEAADRLRRILGNQVPQEAEREVIGQSAGKSGISASNGVSGNGSTWDRIAAQYDLTAPATEAAREWQGWGTALKPAAEQWWLFRKPLSEGTVAANVLRHGTGALNIDACRVATDDATRRLNKSSNGDRSEWRYGRNPILTGSDAGRWPANVCHDGSPEVMDAFARFGERRSAGDYPSDSVKIGNGSTSFQPQQGQLYEGGGTGARFFMCAKADASERVGAHPTVKPVALMEWLVRLVTPSGGKVLDPFAGTGSTLVACDRLGLDAVGIEQDAQTVADAHEKLRRMRARRMIGDAPATAVDPRQGTLL